MTSEKHWCERPNRVLLVNLREGDEAKIRAEELVRDVKSFGATAFCINGGGIVAFYQTRIRERTAMNGFLRALLAGALALLLCGADSTGGTAQPLNDLPNPYRSVTPWGDLPGGRKWGALNGVDIDRDGLS